jgi:hypothetical protein
MGTNINESCDTIGVNSVDTPVTESVRIGTHTKQIDLKKAYNSTDLTEFLMEVFPEEWAPIAARIIESGARYRDKADTTPDKFAPRWSTIPFTERIGSSGSSGSSGNSDPNETYLKSIIYRVHDCMHQLWGLPIPKSWSRDEFYYFKRIWMCAEVAVLTLVEFHYCDWLYRTQGEIIRKYLVKRNTLLFKDSCFHGKTLPEIAARLDELLHKKTMPLWVRDNKYAMIFLKDFVPMLEYDRVNIDHNWKLLIEQATVASGDTPIVVSTPVADTTIGGTIVVTDVATMPTSKVNNIPEYLRNLPNQRYSRNLDGRELTVWMIEDFLHLLKTDAEIDLHLAAFNAKRREKTDVQLPDKWNQCIPNALQK